MDATSKDEVMDDVEFIFETDADTMEAELRSNFDLCAKNPGHKGFIPMNDLTLDHLPDHYKHEELLDFLKLQAELTVLLNVSYTSTSRPKRFPVTEWKARYPYYKSGVVYPYRKKAGTYSSRMGTGFVVSIDRGGDPEWTQRDSSPDSVRSGADEWQEGSCCCSPDCPAQRWARIRLTTALHLVFDQQEMDHTELEFFFNTDKDRAEDRTTKLKGGTVLTASIEGDRCDVSFYTHDTGLVQRLETAETRRERLKDKLKQMYTPESSPAILISHPHGCGKVVSVGEVTEQKLTNVFDRVSTYTTPSCPGSSGAPLLWWSKDEEPRYVIAECCPHSGSLQARSQDGGQLGRCGQYF